MRFGENMKEAIDSRRFHHQLLPMELQCESGFPKVRATSVSEKPMPLTRFIFYFSLLLNCPQGLGDSLIGKGHVLVEEPREAAVYGVAVETDGFIYANADYRKGGDVAGLGPAGETHDNGPSTNGDRAA